MKQDWKSLPPALQHQLIIQMGLAVCCLVLAIGALAFISFSVSALVACLRQFDLLHQHRQLLQVTATFEWQNGLRKENILHESYQHWKAV